MVKVYLGLIEISSNAVYDLGALAKNYEQTCLIAVCDCVWKLWLHECGGAFPLAPFCRRAGDDTWYGAKADQQRDVAD